MTTAAPFPPKRIGRYEILSEIGRGLTSVVHFGFDSKDGHEVAIKILRGRNDEHEDFVRRMFVAEAALVGKVKHPNIIEIYDALVTDEAGYIIMEYAGGGTLDRYCKGGRRLTPKRVVEIIGKCARALDSALQHGLIHRDIKPGNIMLTREDDPKVTDFGAAFQADALTSQIGQVGSLAYMAPEVLEGKPATAQSDIYSLGVVMFYLLTGQLPFLATSPASLAHQIRNYDAPPANSVNPLVPAELTEFLRRALARDPAERIDSWKTFIEQLAPERAPARFGEGNGDAPQTDAQRAAYLKKMPRFAECPSSYLVRLLTVMRWNAVPPGITLAREGDACDAVFLIVSGEARLQRAGHTERMMRAGDVVGDATRDPDTPATWPATVTTTSQATVARLMLRDLRPLPEAVRVQLIACLKQRADSPQ